LIRVVGALMLVVLLAGCGGASGSSLEDAAEATGAETFRVDFVYRFDETAPDREFVFRSTGVFDDPGERGTMTTSGPVPFYGKGVELKEMRLIGSTAYSRWVVKGKTYWMEQRPVERSDDPVGFLIPGPGTPTKPTDVLTRVVLASDENQRLGREDVRGTETTHYRARVSVEKLIQLLPEADRSSAERHARLTDLRFVPVELWIDEESRLRRITIDYREGDDSAMTMTAELFDYGIEVDVEPPDAKVISEEEFNELAGSSETLTVEESGEGEVVVPEEEPARPEHMESP
jgi:hypothetical protein